MLLVARGCPAVDQPLRAAHVLKPSGFAGGYLALLTEVAGVVHTARSTRGSMTLRRERDV